VSATAEGLKIDGRQIAVLSERDPAPPPERQERSRSLRRSVISQG
jgi:hypothetical protein